jgi:predicted secreted protein
MLVAVPAPTASAAPVTSVTLLSAPSLYPVGQKPEARGRIAPAAAGVPVSTEVWTGSAWSRSQQSTTTAGGEFRLPLTYAADSAGSTKYRLAATSDTTKVYSREFTVSRFSIGVHAVSAPARAAISQTAHVVAGVTTTGISAKGVEVSTQFLVNGSWSTSRKATTGADGRATLGLTYGEKTTGSYSWRLVASISGAQAVSKSYSLVRTDAVDPQPTVVVLSAPPSAPVGAAANVTGQVTVGGVPVPDADVSTQFLVNGSWSTSRKGSADGQGKATLPLTYGSDSPGAYSWRLQAVAHGATGVSSSFTLTRTGELPPSVAVWSAPGTATVGTPANVTGKVTRQGKPLANARVTTEFLVDGTWSVSRQATSDSQGFATLPLTYGDNAPGSYSWRLRATVNGQSSASASFVITRTVGGRVFALSAPSYERVNVGAVVRLKATYGSAPAVGARVQTQFLVKGAWSSSQSSTTNGSGEAVLPLTYGAGTIGTYSWRLVATIDGVHTTSQTYTTMRWDNGAMPDALLCQVPWAKKGIRIACEALPSFAAMNAAYRATSGKNFQVDHVSTVDTNCYRGMADQIRLRNAYLAGLGANASVPGKSSHGWGTACDINMGGYPMYSSPAYLWLKANAAKYGWVNNVAGEDWHWAYLPQPMF